MTTDMDETTDLAQRRAMFDRAHELCRGNNMRIYRQSWSKSEWSPYQRSVAAAILCVVLKDSERDTTNATNTTHGPWMSELQVTTAALNDVLSEMPPEPPPPTQHGDRPPLKKSDLH